MHQYKYNYNVLIIFKIYYIYTDKNNTYKTTSEFLKLYLITTATCCLNDSKKEITTRKNNKTVLGSNTHKKTIKSEIKIQPK